MMSSLNQLSTSLLLLLLACVADASKSGTTTSVNSGAFLELQQKLSPGPGDVLENLDQYDKFWIEVKRTSGSCVWSECALGYTNTGDDDEYGDGRDGDEQWYQYRTQSFCANAAYSLYGRKRSDYHPLGFMGCTRRHFINSFFTYGGADNLLKSIGKTPQLYFDESEYAAAAYNNNNNGNGNNNGNDDGSYNTVEPSNAKCLPYYGTVVEDDDDNYFDQDYNQEGGDRRELKSGDNYNAAAYSSTLGCSSKGDYVMGVFKGGSCDGNYFLRSIDKFRSYNRQQKRIGCHSLWTQGANEVTYERMQELLSNSWTCDIRLYPNNCPDPYGVKGHYEYALREAAHGGDPMRAYRYSVWRRPIRALSWLILVVTVIVLLITYNIKNHKRIMARGGGGWKVGLQCLKEDFMIHWGKAKVAAQEYWARTSEEIARRNAERRMADEKRRAELSSRSSRSSRSGRSRSLNGLSSKSTGRRRKKSRSSPRKSKSRSKSRGDGDDGADDYDGGGGVELGRVKDKSRRKSKRSKDERELERSERRSSSRRGSSRRSGDEGDEEGGSNLELV